MGDLVTAADPDTGALASRPVAAVLVHPDTVTGTVSIDGERIATTPEHPFAVLGQGFLPAADLVPGDRVLRSDGTTGTVSEIRWDGGPAPMWNLTVAVDHTFFVGEGAWWVHNECDFVDLASASRREHILDGEIKPNGTFSGGHRAGTGFPGKSEFPARWSDDEVMHYISDVATDPAAGARTAGPDVTFATGTRDGIDIEVMLLRNEIWTAYPTNVLRNP